MDKTIKQIDDIFRKITGATDLENAKKAVVALCADMLNEQAPVLVKYIGNRKTHTDSLYGSLLTWKKGETLAVPGKIAERMFRHIDVYERGVEASRDLLPEEKAPAVEKKKNETLEGDKSQEARDAVSRMDNIEMIKEFVHNNFAGNKLPGTIKNIDTARNYAVSLIDRIGAL